jgi:2-polyprenyl-6-methoxyphenol hydroxylase-like FAD-dependent oxidoreductase
MKNDERTNVYDACIVGIGIGGLSAAISILKQSRKCLVESVSPLKIILCERDESLHNRRQGYGLTLTNSLTGPLAKLGLLDQCLERNCLSRNHFSFTSDGNILGYYGRIVKEIEEENSKRERTEKDSSNNQQQDGSTQQFGGSRGNIRIPREDLRNLMLQELVNLSNYPETVVLPSYDFVNSSTVDEFQRSANIENLCASSSRLSSAVASNHQLENNLSLKWGYKFLFYEENDEFITSYFEVSSSPPSFSSEAQKKMNEIISIKSYLLIGADGIKSRVRQCRDLVLSPSTSPSLLVPSHHHSPLRYLEVTVIIGISAIYHPLLFEKGFYVLDGIHRLFVMPYYTPSSSSTSDVASSAVKKADLPLIMWQLSFSGLTEEESLNLRKLSFSALLEYIQTEITKEWFPLVNELIQSTLFNEIWVTPLYDRDEMMIQCKYHPSYEIHHVKKEKSLSSLSRDDKEKEVESLLVEEKAKLPLEILMKKRKNTRCTVLGDACHPMSMFKGQGANLSLDDGILFATTMLECFQRKTGKKSNTKHDKKKRKIESVLSVEAAAGVDDDDIDSNIYTEKSSEETVCFSFGNVSKEQIYLKIRHFEREMTSKTFPKVLLSRKAASHLHSRDFSLLLQQNSAFDAFSSLFVTSFSAFNIYDYIYSINGIKDPTTVHLILQQCYHEGVNANNKEKLEENFKQVVSTVLTASSSGE